MKCIRCDHDSKKKDRANRLCPGCGKEFAFEPAEGAPVTDMLFKNAIAAVSGGGRLRWGVEHLYYEVCRRLRPKFAAVQAFRTGLLAVVVATSAAILLLGDGTITVLTLVAPGLVAAAIVTARHLTRRADPYPKIDPAAFGALWDRWCRIHGTPEGVIQRRPMPAAPPATPLAAMEPDIGDYSFDRAVICDRARTVDLLIANNYHFENNCAVLSVDGYPQGPFPVVMAMLKRNPKLQVYALHDATPAGCAMAHEVASNPAWFNGEIRVVDLGLRPGHAKPFLGLFQSPPGGSRKDVLRAPGISDTEALWLGAYALELAAIRPEQTLKRLFRGMRAHAEDDFSGGGVTNCGSFDSGTSVDGTSVDGDAADSFG